MAVQAGVSLSGSQLTAQIAAFRNVAVSAPCAALSALCQNDSRLCLIRAGMEHAALREHHPVLEQEGTISLEQDALAVPQYAVAECEALLHPPPGGSAGFVQPNGIHVANFRRRVAPSGGLQLDAAVLAQNLPRRRLCLFRRVDKGVAHRQGVGAGSSVAGDVDHGLGVVVELEGQHR